MAKRNKTQEIADGILESLKNGTAPWIKPWTPDQSAVPHNPVTGTRYKGINFIHLINQGKEDPRWITYKQAEKKGWQVKRGSKGTVVQYWQFNKEVKSKDEEGNEIKETVKLQRPLLRHYYVFNAEDIEGIPELKKEENEKAQWERHERAENLLEQSGANIAHIRGDKAAYYPVQDRIVLPEKDQFPTPDNYYVTALHELGHWTGHESRLDRGLTSVFGSTEYAQEELRAEIASYMLGMQLGVGHDPGQHLAYVDSWIKHLEDHPTEIFKACADAEKIQSYILEFEQDRAREETMEQDTPYYILTDESLVALTPEQQFAGDVYAGETERFNTPAAALQAAIEAKQAHAGRLEESEVYIYKVTPPDDLQKEPVLVTGTPHTVRAMWEKNIGTEFPENLLNAEVRAMPGMPESQVNELTGKRFISYYSTQELDAVGNINLELQQALQRGTTLGVLRFENAVEMDSKERGKVDLTELQAGIDGVVYTEKGRPVAAVATDASKLHLTMFKATQGLEKRYIDVPYKDKEQAKNFGALWDKSAKSWFIVDGLDDKLFAEWIIEKAVTGDSPQFQFAEAIREMGGDLEGRLPEMDGKFHRIAEIDGKRGNKNISYVGYLDDVPAGYIKNFRGGEQRWKMAGVTLTDEDRARLKKEGQEKKAQREKERQEVYAQRAKESEAYTKDLAQATGKEEYFKEKGINIKDTGIRVDAKGKMVLPLCDVDGEQWSHQTLSRNGFKQLFKDSKLQGVFALVGADSVQDIKGDILIAEGYSTAATLHEVTEQPVIVSVTSNNLKHVASSLHDRFPDKAVYIMGDDDTHLERQGKINAGKVKAEEAAQAVDGAVILPSFGKEKPSKERTDFNDMAKEYGKGALADYIAAKLELARSGKKIEKEKVREKEQEPVVVER